MSIKYLYRYIAVILFIFINVSGLLKDKECIKAHQLSNLHLSTLSKFNNLYLANLASQIAIL